MSTGVIIGFCVISFGIGFGLAGILISRDHKELEQSNRRLRALLNAVHNEFKERAKPIYPGFGE